MTKVLVITGTPGVGKTTLTKKLEEEGYHTYNLYDIAKTLGCLGDFDENRDAIIIDDDCLFDGIDEFIENLGNEIVIFEGHYADVVPRDYLLHCFVLSPPIEVLRPRLVERGYSEEKVMENIEAHIMKECYYDALEYYGEEKVTELGHMNFDDLLNSIKKKL